MAVHEHDRGGRCCSRSSCALVIGFLLGLLLVLLPFRTPSVAPTLSCVFSHHHFSSCMPLRVSTPFQIPSLSIVYCPHLLLPAPSPFVLLLVCLFSPLRCEFMYVQLSAIDMYITYPCRPRPSSYLFLV
ncbi:hypothetical protein FPV67DRAFT_1105019 [Lyophyllum atratum]|nr:hypothetical protein FPV67DRAFT_1105019 [Lyophyllum atratum]